MGKGRSHRNLWPSETAPQREPTIGDIHYAAGIIEGEGYFAPKRPRKGRGAGGQVGGAIRAAAMHQAREAEVSVIRRELEGKH